jgi:hypothetical protein
MKRYLALILIYSVSTITSVGQQAEPAANKVSHIATALNHLTVLEFQEPVTLAAAGSADFQIERQDNKVFVKPLKSGASTDLFVWTASRRFSYELEPAGEVKDMNFAIDNPVATPKPAVDPPVQMEQIADMMLTRAFLGAEPVDHAGISVPKNQVGLRVEQVFRTKNSLYIQYTLENQGKDPYHVGSPTVYCQLVIASGISLPALEHHQLDLQTIQKLGDTKTIPWPIAHAESTPQDVLPGESARGVVTIRQDVESPVVLEIVFDVDVRATLVL